MFRGDPMQNKEDAMRLRRRIQVIPKRTYGVVAFRETKKNMKRDRSRYFKDTVSKYKMIDFSGDWNDIQFEVNKEVRGIEIRF